MPHRHRPPPSPADLAAIRKARSQLKDALTHLDAVAPPEGSLIVLDTIEQVLKILGGTSKVAKLTGATMQQVSDWKRNGFFATNTYKIMSEALAHTGEGYTASPALWRMKDRAPDNPAAAGHSSTKDE